MVSTAGPQTAHPSLGLAVAGHIGVLGGFSSEVSRVSHLRSPLLPAPVRQVTVRTEGPSVTPHPCSPAPIQGRCPAGGGTPSPRSLGPQVLLLLPPGSVSRSFIWMFSVCPRSCSGFWSFGRLPQRLRAVVHPPLELPVPATVLGMGWGKGKGTPSPKKLLPAVPGMQVPRGVPCTQPDPDSELGFLFPV